VRAPFIDHVTLTVRDLDASRAFYECALEPFGIHVSELEGDDGSTEVALGPEGSEDLVLREGEPTATVHVAFAAHDQGTVDAFHAAALEAGATNGEPGRRPRYHERYYAAYVLDPDGNNVEAVCHIGPNSKEKDPAGNTAVEPEEPR
jgi:catechol 2,3-dioxygenase-like lactoylglutathione lyase family enzyme